MKDLTKQNLEVRTFNLKQIVENINAIPSNGKFDESPKLTAQQKKRLMELVSKYNEYGAALQCGQALMETAKAMDEIAQLAETYALTESEDWMQGDTVKRDYKQLKQICKEYKNLTKECFGGIQRMAALYEDSAHILERYYKIESMNEYASGFEENVPAGIPKQVAAVAPQVDPGAEEQEESSVLETN